VGVNNNDLKVFFFAIMPIFVADVLIWQKFGVVTKLPLQTLIGGDIFIPQLCTICYL
jgi:hypothetical protein